MRSPLAKSCGVVVWATAIPAVIRNTLNRRIPGIVSGVVGEVTDLPFGNQNRQVGDLPTLFAAALDAHPVERAPYENQRHQQKCSRERVGKHIALFVRQANG